MPSASMGEQVLRPLPAVVCTRRLFTLTEGSLSVCQIFSKHWYTMCQLTEVLLALPLK